MRQHETDYFSLAAGLLFTVLGVLFAVSAATGWQIDGRWIAPTVLIALGAGGVAASLAASKRQQRDARGPGHSRVHGLLAHGPLRLTRRSRPPDPRRTPSDPPRGSCRAGTRRLGTAPPDLRTGRVTGATVGRLARYSHSMVPGGLLVTSRTTRLMSRTSLVIRVEIRASRS